MAYREARDSHNRTSSFSAKTMRVVAIHLLLLVVALYLHLGGVQAITNDKKNVIYNNGNRPNPTAYAEFIEELRHRLASEVKVHGIALLSPFSAAVPVDDRFILVQLKNGDGDVITIVLYKVNVDVVGYLDTVTDGRVSVQTKFYYLDDIPEETLKAFPKLLFRQIPLHFSGSYQSLGDRGTQGLGHSALNLAIANLRSGDYQRRALLVITQMVAEAARIRYIEHLVRRNMISNSVFLPNSKVISLEDTWLDISDEIQLSSESGAFIGTVSIKSVANKTVPIGSVLGVMRQAAVALLLYRSCGPPIIKCLIVIPEPTINILGRDGLCANVKDGDYHNGNAIILYPCNAQSNELWTLKRDGTIRSKDKCLTTSGYAKGDYMMIYDCDEAVKEATKWTYINAGTIMNPHSSLVLEAESSFEGTTLKVAEDHNSSAQAWTTGIYNEHPVSYISGYREMCLQENGVEAPLALAKCVIGTEASQKWVLYGDSTIRLHRKQTLCVTSDGHHGGENIILRECRGGINQRWTFRADGSIFNPNAGLVMDALLPSSQRIVLNEPTGTPNQKWLAF